MASADDNDIISTVRLDFQLAKMQRPEALVFHTL